MRRPPGAPLASASGRATLPATAELEFGDPDFKVRQLRSNVVLRGEDLSGSRLFLVKVEHWLGLQRRPAPGPRPGRPVVPPSVQALG